MCAWEHGELVSAPVALKKAWHSLVPLTYYRRHRVYSACMLLAEKKDTEGTHQYAIFIVCNVT